MENGAVLQTGECRGQEAIELLLEQREDALSRGPVGEQKVYIVCTRSSEPVRSACRTYTVPEASVLNGMCLSKDSACDMDPGVIFPSRISEMKRAINKRPGLLQAAWHSNA